MHKHLRNNNFFSLIQTLHDLWPRAVTIWPLTSLPGEFGRVPVRGGDCRGPGHARQLLQEVVRYKFIVSSLLYFRIFVLIFPEQFCRSRSQCVTSCRWFWIIQKCVSPSVCCISTCTKQQSFTFATSRRSRRLTDRFRVNAFHSATALLICILQK